MLNEVDVPADAELRCGGSAFSKAPKWRQGRRDLMESIAIALDFVRTHSS